MNQQVEILVNGKPVKQIAHEGRVYIVAKAGARYEIRVKNNSTSRVLAVASVDGVNVVTGKTAALKGRGYIINGYGSRTIRGFRTSTEEVHPFIFSSPDESYASKSENGDKSQCGVIGVAFHSEKQPCATTVRNEYTTYTYPYKPWPYVSPWEPRWYATSGSLGTGVSTCFNSTIPNSSITYTSSVDNNSFDMGTKFDEQAVQDKVITAGFKTDALLYLSTIYYASAEALGSMGVPIYQSREISMPEPFSDFCKPPR